MKFELRRDSDRQVRIYTTGTFVTHVGKVEGVLPSGIVVSSYNASDGFGHRLILEAVDAGIAAGFWDKDHQSWQMEVDVSVPAHTGEIPRATPAEG